MIDIYLQSGGSIELETYSNDVGGLCCITVPHGHIDSRQNRWLILTAYIQYILGDILHRSLSSILHRWMCLKIVGSWWLTTLSIWCEGILGGQ